MTFDPFFTEREPDLDDEPVEFDEDDRRESDAEAESLLQHYGFQ